MGASDIYKASYVDGKFREPENLGDLINTAYWDGLPYITPDEKVLIFFRTSPAATAMAISM